MGTLDAALHELPTLCEPVPDVAAPDVEAEHHGQAEPHHLQSALLVLIPNLSQET